MQYIEVVNAAGDYVQLEVTNKIAELYERVCNHLMEYGYPKSDRQRIDIGQGRILVFEETMGSGFYRLQEPEDDDELESEEEIDEEEAEEPDET